MRGLGVNGFATKNISIANVPETADILAAFLYWGTLESTQDLGAGARGAKFGYPDLNPVLNDISAIAKPLGAGNPPCWSTGGATGEAEDGTKKLRFYRADVLRFLPISPTTKKRWVNRNHTVQLPDSGSGGNKVPIAEGASLVVMYRDPSLPLAAITIYDAAGGSTMNQSNQALTQTLQGFYQAFLTPADAQLTIMMADGQANFSERLLFNGQLLALNPFVGGAGERWDNLTFTVSNLMGGVVGSVDMTVDRIGINPFDCLAMAGAVLRTKVVDGDGDGIIDRLETTSGLTDPTGQVLPDLPAMGASPNVKDIFVELGYLQHVGPDRYDTPLGPVAEHSHLPPQGALLKVAAAFLNAPPPPNGPGPVRIHFDVGPNPPGYQPPPPLATCLASWTSSCAIIPASVARGGEAINEVCNNGGACVERGDLFPGFPAIGWKRGFRFLRDQPLNATTLAPITETACAADPANCRRRFDRNRRHIFHYLLAGHVLGLPKWLIADGTLVNIAVEGNTATVTTLADHGLSPGARVTVSGATGDPDLNGVYSVGSVPSPTTFTFGVTNVAPGIYKNRALGVGNGIPRSTSGVADKPGGDLMLTLGLWDNFVGSEFMQASTIFHELGHNLWLRHGGAAGEPNCKCNYFSSMSYLFQVRGLSDPQGRPHINYSGQELPRLDEASLVEAAGLGVTTPYLPRWFAPLVPGTLAFDLGTTAATKHCDGTPITDGAKFVRLDGASLSPPIDWNGDGLPTTGTLAQDVNFSGGLSSQNGFNDWLNTDLRQAGSRRMTGKLSLEIAKDDLAAGDEGLGDEGLGDEGLGDEGLGDEGLGDEGLGDEGLGDEGLGGELDLDTAKSLGNAPNALTAAVAGTGKRSVVLNWTPPHVGAVTQYEVWRATGLITPANKPAKIATVSPVPPATTPPTTFTDTAVQNNKTYTYFVAAVFGGDGTKSGPSNFVTVLVK